MSNFRQPVRPRIRAKARNKGAIVILNWGAFAWHRSFPMNMTVGELRRQLAKELGRIFDGQVVGLELFSTGSDASPDRSLTLHELTHPPYRNVCLDVTGRPRRRKAAAIESVGERLLQKHMCNDRFQAGVDQRLWRLIQLEWPFATLGVRRTMAGTYCEIGLRLNLERYPVAPPLVQLWDLEAQTAIEAQRWPEPFINFAAANYPEFADFEPAPFSQNLVRVSTEVARRLKEPASDMWDIHGDLTQLLSRLSGHLR